MQKKNSSDATDDLAQRLDILISLTLDSLADDGEMKIATKIHRLTDLEVSASLIAQIVGKSSNYVTATQSQQRSKKGKK
jgi:hypothetical protein